jgi:hypothetical protein
LEKKRDKLSKSEEPDGHIEEKYDDEKTATYVTTDARVVSGKMGLGENGSFCGAV